MTWGGFVLGLLFLLLVLAKMGAQSGPSSTVGDKLAVPVAANEWTRGSSSTPHVLVEYSDFQCPACATYYPVIKRLTDEHGTDVRVIFRHFPLTELHENALIAGIAAEAAGKQGKFFEMHDALFNTQDTWGTDKNPEITFEDLAGSLGLDSKKFKADLSDPELKKKVENSRAEALRNGLSGTPALFLDGKLIENPNSYAELVALVTEKK